MDTEAIVVALIMLVVCLIPLILIGRFGSGKSKKCIKILNEFAAKNNTDIADFDQWNNKAIGINTNRNAILYVHNNESNVELLKADLDKIKSCRLAKSYQTESGVEAAVSGVDKIGLDFIDGENGKVLVSLDFFNIADGQFSYEQELLLAEKWKTVADTVIRK